MENNFEEMSSRELLDMLSCYKYGQSINNDMAYAIEKKCKFIRGEAGTLDYKIKIFAADDFSNVKVKDFTIKKNSGRFKFMKLNLAKPAEKKFRDQY